MHYTQFNSLFGRLFLCAAVITYITACKKHTYSEAVPLVQIDKMEMVGDDTAEITATIISEGAVPVEHAGFCFDYQPNPILEKNQVLVQPSGSRIRTRLKLFSDSMYYFRAFATNSYGYKLSEDFVFTAKKEGKTAPCPLELNKVLYQGTLYPTGTVKKVNPVYGKYAIYIEAMGGGPFMQLEFNRVPTNGIYTTNDVGYKFEQNNHQQEVMVYLNGAYVDSGDPVYIAEGADGSYTVSFCDLGYRQTSTLTIKASTNFSVK
jgi:hypothetical protein